MNSWTIQAQRLSSGIFLPEQTKLFSKSPIRAAQTKTKHLYFLNNCQNILEVESETWGRKREDYEVFGKIMGGKGDHGIAGWKWFHPGFDSLLKHPFLEKKPVYLCVSSGNSLIISQSCQTLDLGGSSSLGWPLSLPSENSPDPLLYNGMVHLQWTWRSHPPSIIFYLLPSFFSAPVLAL